MECYGMDVSGKDVQTHMVKSTYKDGRIFFEFIRFRSFSQNQISNENRSRWK